MGPGNRRSVELQLSTPETAPMRPLPKLPPVALIF